MSNFTKKPYIELVLAELSDADVKKLINFINGKSAGGTGAISYTAVYSITEMLALTAAVTPVDFKYSPTIFWKGYFIKSTGRNTFITIKTEIDLFIADVYDVQSDSLIFKEKVNSDTIRGILREFAYINAVIDSEIGDVTEIKEVENLPLEGEENTIYLSNSNIIAGNEAVEIPVPAAGDVGKVIKVGSNGYSLANTLYRHHFDVVLTHADLASIPEGARVAINVNALSNSATPWSTLSELDGGGFIVAAFGTIVVPAVVTSYVFELKIFYSSLNTLLINIHDLTDGSVKCAALTTVAGGSPNEFELHDSVAGI